MAETRMLTVPVATRSIHDCSVKRMRNTGTKIIFRENNI